MASHGMKEHATPDAKCFVGVAAAETGMAPTANKPISGIEIIENTSW
jgi:hypothetical protein